MKKFVILFVLSIFITPVFAGFTTLQLEEYNQLTEVLDSSSYIIDLEYPGANQLIQEFINEDHTKGTYQEMLDDLILLVLTIRSVESWVNKANNVVVYNDRLVDLVSEEHDLYSLYVEDESYLSTEAYLNWLEKLLVQVDDLWCFEDDCSMYDWAKVYLNYMQDGISGEIDYDQDVETDLFDKLIFIQETFAENHGFGLEGY